MRRAILFAMAGLVAAPAAAEPAARGDILLLESAIDAAGKPLVRIAPDGRSLPVLRPLAESDLSRAATARLDQGIASILPALHARARTISGDKLVCAGIGPRFLIHFSPEDGGFARQGFWFAGADGKQSLCNDHYIDLVVDQRSLDNGEFEEVLAHESGHVLLRRMLGSQPPPPSRKFHSVIAITDPLTAFDEGMGIHMQSMAARFTTTPGFRARMAGVGTDPIAESWFSRRETWLRHAWVRSNQLVYAKQPVAPGDPYARWLAEDRSTALDYCHLRTGDELVASEGFVASFLYRWMASQLDEAATLVEAEARYNKLIDALARQKNWAAGDRPVISFIESWAAAYPSDRERMIALFVEMTHGATASGIFRHQIEKATCEGAAGDIEAFGDDLGAARTARSALVADVVSGRVGLADALGPPLWVAAPDTKIAIAPWAPERTQPLTIDLNTAGEPALTLMFGPAIDAAHIVAERRANGPFLSIAALAQRTGLVPAQTGQLVDAARAFSALPPVGRD